VRYTCPEARVIQAFNAGLATLDENYDVMMKADADLISNELFKTISFSIRS
jgi:hypothetical protein